MRHTVRHRTLYAYDEEVVDSYGLAWLRPRPLPWQRVEAVRVVVEPTPADQSVTEDHHGNLVHYLQVLTPHRELDVVAQSVVDVDPPAHEAATLARPWSTLRPLLDPTSSSAWLVTDFALASPLVRQSEDVRAFAAESFSAHHGVAEVVDDLVHRIYAGFAYRPGATSVASTIDDVLAAGAGVCQDFAHLLLACLRSHGLAARYVSGYLATEPPPGRERVLGADATHAWVAVWLGDDEWLAADPTNDQRVGERYVTVAWGRDYGDVPPLKGVIVSDAQRSELTVEVDVTPA